MKILCRAVLLFLLNFLSQYLIAQPDLQFTRITSKDGLSGDIVYSISQDKNGFLWIGTHQGLNRYDGYHFVHYNYDPYDTNSISGNNVICIKEDNEGLLWLSTSKGLNSLDPITNKIKRYIPADVKRVQMEDIFLVNDSILLIAANTAVYKFNKKTGQFTVIKLPTSFAADLHARFTRDSQGRIFLGSYGWDGVIINWENATGNYLNSREGLHVSPLHDTLNPIKQIYFDSQNNAWCFTAKETFITKEISGKKIFYPFVSKDVHAPENLISNFYEEPGKKLWICTGAGLVFYDYAGNTFYRYREQAGDQESLSNNRTTCLMQDRNGTYWVGTFGSGLCHFTINPKFKHITIDTSLNEEDRIVYGLRALHSGKILIGTFSKTKFLMDEEKKLTMLNPNDSIPVDSIILETTGRERQTFSDADYWVFHELHNGHAYPGSKKFNAAMKDISLTETVIDEHNDVYFTNGLELVGPNSRLGPNNRKFFYDAINDIQVAGENHLLLATHGGLILFNTATSSIEKAFLPEKNNVYSIGTINVNGILPDGKGSYWITTADAGFDFWNTKANRFYHYTTKDGLPDNTIYDILFDKHGRLWIGTSNGLSCFDTATKTFTNFDRSDGLINTEFNSGSACVDKHGYLYFGGMNGIDYFHPDSFTHEQSPPPVYVSAFKVFDQMQPLSGFYKLPTNDNSITIEFTANDIVHSSKIFYRFKLEGVDESWVVRKGMNIALYNKLPPGKYHFAAQASYNNKDWSKPLNIDFTIATPWFQTWWFFALLVLIIVAAIYLLFRYRLKQQLQLIQVRNRIHRDLHDDVGATLSSVKAYSEILKDNPNNPVIAELIKENASQMIEQLEVIAWAANPHHDSFGSLIEKINHYAVPICFAKNIEYDISPDGISKDVLIPGEIRQNLFLIAKEAINNTVKYSDAAHCTIRSFITHGKFIMEISDDGNGFDDAIKGTGYGLQNMFTRIKETGGEISIHSEKGKGTKIKLQLPFPFKIPNSWDRKNNFH